MTEPTLLALHRQKIVALEAEVARLRAALVVLAWGNVRDRRAYLREHGHPEMEERQQGWTYAVARHALDPDMAAAELERYFSGSLAEARARGLTDEERVNRLDEVFGKWPGDEIAALREANEGIAQLEGLRRYANDELLDELERRSAPFRATQTEADLVRAVAALRTERDTLRTTVAGLREAWTLLHNTFDGVHERYTEIALTTAEIDALSRAHTLHLTAATPAPDGRDTDEGGE